MIASTPALHVVTKSPLVVRGTAFKTGERVTLTVAGTTFVVRTTRLGTFRANLGAVLGDRCSYRIVASGARGDRAMLAARTGCAPASSP